MNKTRKEYGNRKWRKKRKMEERFWFNLYENTSRAYKGWLRDFKLAICKSSSIEAMDKINTMYFNFMNNFR